MAIEFLLIEPQQTSHSLITERELKASLLKSPPRDYLFLLHFFFTLENCRTGVEDLIVEEAAKGLLCLMRLLGFIFFMLFLFRLSTGIRLGLSVK